MVPITILGAGNVLPKGTLAIKKSHIKIIIDAPIETREMELWLKENNIHAVYEKRQLEKVDIERVISEKRLIGS